MTWMSNVIFVVLFAVQWDGVRLIKWKSYKISHCRFVDIDKIVDHKALHRQQKIDKHEHHMKSYYTPVYVNKYK